MNIATPSNPTTLVPAHWRTVPLASVADIGSGITKGRLIKSAGVLVPYLRVANVQTGHVDLTDVKQIEATAEEIQRFGLRRDDVLMTEGGDPDKLGRGALWDGSVDPCIHQNHIFRVRLDQSRVAPKYFARLLGTPWALSYFLKAAKQTTGIATINKTQLSAFPVPLPPLPEQKRIADILDKADAIRRKRQQAIELTENLLRSAFLEMFGDPVTNPKGWPLVGGDKVFAELRYGTSQRCHTDRARGLPVLRIPNIVGGMTDWSDLKYATCSQGEMEVLSLRSGDLLLVRSNGNPDHIGRYAVFDSDTTALYASYLIRGRLQANWDPWFLQAQLSAESYRAVLRVEAQTTAGNYNISTAGLRNLKFVKPPQADQTRFATVRRNIMMNIVRRREAHFESEKLGHALTQRAFLGAL